MSEQAQPLSWEFSMDIDMEMQAWYAYCGEHGQLARAYNVGLRAHDTLVYVAAEHDIRAHGGTGQIPDCDLISDRVAVLENRLAKIRTASALLVAV
jgi:hypothetical protein